MSRLIRCYQNSALLTDRCDGLTISTGEERFESIEKLIEKDDLLSAMGLIDKKEKEDNLDSSQKTRLLLLKGKSLHFKAEYEKAYNIALNALETAKNADNPIAQFCCLSLMETIVSWQQSEKKILAFYSFCHSELERLEQEYPSKIKEVKGRYLSLLGRVLYPIDKEKAFEYIEESLSLTKKEENLGLEASIHHIISHMYTDIGEYNKAIEHALECQSINEKLNEEAIGRGNLRELRSNHSQLGYIYMRTGDNDNCIKYGEKHREYSKEANDEFSQAYGDFLCGTGYGQKGMFRKALEYALEGYDIWIEMGELFGASWCALTAAVNYRKVGELNESLEYYKKTETINRKLGNEFSTARALQGIGIVYKEKGMLEQAENNLREALKIYRENQDYIYTRPGRDIARSLFHLVLISLDRGKYEQSLELLKQLEDYYSKQEISNPIVEQLYTVSKGIYLVQTGGEEGLVEAERILNQLVEQETTDIEVTSMAILTLCGINIRKIQETKNGIILFQKTENLLNLLLELARKERSSILLAEVYSLQSQIALVKIEVEEAEKLLIKAQKIAEKGNISSLAIRISNIYDSLLEHLDSWEDFTAHLPSIGEKLELTRIEEMLDELLRFQSLISDVKLEKEEPVLFFIMDESGKTIFAEKFDFDLQDDSMRKLMTLSKDNFGEVSNTENYIPRFKFHDYTVILTAVSDLLFGYVFIGNSYIPIRSMEIFVQEIKTESTLNNISKKAITGESFLLEERINISKIIDQIFVNGHE